MDPHTILGIGQDATEEQIRGAFKALAMKWHPDRHLKNRSEATAKFVEINRAQRDMLRALRRARRSAESTASSSVSGSAPSTPDSTASSEISDYFSQSSHTSATSMSTGSQSPPSTPPATPPQSPPSTFPPNVFSVNRPRPRRPANIPPPKPVFSNIPAKPTSGTTCQRGRPSSRSPPSSEQLWDGAAESHPLAPPPTTPPSAAARPVPAPPQTPKPSSKPLARPPSRSAKPTPADSRLRKQSRSRSCRPPPHRSDFTPKSILKRPSASLKEESGTGTANTSPSSSVVNLGPEVVEEETLHPTRSVLRVGGDVPKRFVHPLNMTLEELAQGRTYHFRVARYKRSGRKSIVPLELTVAPGTKPGTEIVVEGAGNERNDKTVPVQAIVFLVKEIKHVRFQRVRPGDGTDLSMDVRLPWVDSLNEKEGEVYFTGVDGKEHAFEVDYCKRKVLAGTAILPGAGMPAVDGKNRGRLFIHWEISSPASSWDAIKQVLKFKN